MGLQWCNSNQLVKTKLRNFKLCIKIQSLAKGSEMNALGSRTCSHQGHYANIKHGSPCPHAASPIGGVLGCICASVLICETAP